MLKNKAEMEILSPAYKFVGYDDNGNREFLVNIKENNHSNKTVKNLDDGLLDDELSDDYFDCEWREEPPKDENSLTQIDFMRMDFRECEYHLYK